MTNLGTKIIIGSMAAVGGSGSIYGGYLLMTKKTIRERLEEDKYRILDTTVSSNSSEHDYSHWSSNISNWEETSKFVGIEVKSQETEEKIKALKNKCESVLDRDSEDSDYENAKKYCAVAIQDSKK